MAGRGAECARLDQALADARQRHSRVLVLRGEPGIGKSALLEYAAERAEGFRVLRAVGVQWEMELPFAALHQLCMGLLEGRVRLPAPQGEALETAFGLSAGSQPDRFSSGWPRSACCPTRRRSIRSSAWLTTSSGLIGPRRRYSRSWLGA